jgi:hypothetical protein
MSGYTALRINEANNEIERLKKFRKRVIIFLLIAPCFWPVSLSILVGNSITDFVPDGFTIGWRILLVIAAILVMWITSAYTKARVAKLRERLERLKSK